VATEVRPHAARHRGWPCDRDIHIHDQTVVALHRKTTQCRVHEPLCRSWLHRGRERTLVHPQAAAVRCTHERSSRQLGCPAMPSMLRRAPGCAPPCIRHASHARRDLFPGGPSCRASQFCHPVSVWQAEDARRGQPAAALGGARAPLPPPSLRRATRRTPTRHSTGTLGVLTA
jgi:hypothetical protein